MSIRPFTCTLTQAELAEQLSLTPEWPNALEACLLRALNIQRPKQLIRWALVDINSGAQTAMLQGAYLSQ
ncbi:MAG: hypothetical protein VKJ06_01285 [Vampirovibrionales bacterium]|nr:hypothetical protein [Vampirovibrionales bacterium]